MKRWSWMFMTLCLACAEIEEGDLLDETDDGAGGKSETGGDAQLASGGSQSGGGSSNATGGASSGGSFTSGSGGSLSNDGGSVSTGGAVQSGGSSGGGASSAGGAATGGTSMGTSGGSSSTGGSSSGGASGGTSGGTGSGGTSTGGAPPSPGTGTPGGPAECLLDWEASASASICLEAGQADWEDGCTNLLDCWQQNDCTAAECGASPDDTCGQNTVQNASAGTSFAAQVFAELCE